MEKFYSMKFSKVLFDNPVFLGKLLAAQKTATGLLFCCFFQLAPSEVFAQRTFSYTYQNVTRNNGGGTLEQGDTIEVRALVKVDTRTDNFYYIDTIRAGTQYIPNSLKIITNEGLTFLGPYTDAGSDDKGVYTTTGGISRLRVNLGSGASNPGATTASFGSTSGGGTVNPGDLPKFYGTTLFIVAYRLVITANNDDIIYLTGNYYYDSTYKKSGSNHTDQKTFRFNYAGIKIIQNLGLCINFSSASFTAESDFGRGSVQNRAAGAIVPGYTKVNLDASNPNDGYYSIVNNTSANGNTARVFGVWDIIGDHTGATDPVAGNPPTAASTNGGYMLVVNSAYPTGEAYRDVIKDVCPNTYYEFSAWVRNICGKCGTDKNSVQTNLPGVQPNLAFTINDVDYYTTGNIPYTQEWVKRGFMYKTGPTETSFKITIKNNAPGGGGNDWVLDDIKLATCYPNLTMNPSDTGRACAGVLIHLSDTVRSYFNNYTNFCWEKTTDGITWTSIGVCGTKTPVLKNGLWEYVADYAFVPVAADSGSSYRLKVATTFPNLSDANCAVGNSQKVFLKVYNMDCSVLEAKFLSFSGKIANDKATLKWVSQNETNLKEYEIEKSVDGINFYKSGVVASVNDQNGANYIYNDPGTVSSVVYYRLKLISNNVNDQKYSKAIVLYNKNASFKISSTNPFKDNLKVDIFIPEDGMVVLNLFDVFGRVVSKKSVQISKGNSQAVLDNVSKLPTGMYVLRAVYNGSMVQNKLYKAD